MILPIVAYGDPVLKKVASDIDKDYPNLNELIANMFETMYNANGVGLAAPQVGLSIRLFVVDGEPFDEQKLKGFKKAFINAHIIERGGDESGYNEGCLSIPDIREQVKRPEWIKIQYLDENLQTHEEIISGLGARIVQHEYDHIEGILFLDHISPLRRRMLKNSLDNISKGEIKVDYKMRYPFRTKRRKF